MSEVLVAASNLQPGTPLIDGSVRWQEWPRSAVDPTFITQDTAPNMSAVIKGAVVRAPLVEGEPLTAEKIVHADSAGFMAAMVNPGMRAVSVAISTESGAGGFILPNDRVDVLETVLVSDQPRRFGSHTLLSAVRVLAVDQTFKEDKDQKVVLAKTATLELTPHQAEQIERAAAAGTISLSLRSLGDDGVHNVPPASADAHAGPADGATAPTTIIRYGVARVSGGEQGD